jgi:glucose-6-phosphate isomerase
MLAGAKAMDDVTRVAVVARNPAAILATLWYFASNGRGEKAMVVLPYKDRLDLFSKYLQQLIMESLGKEYDLDGKPVNQGLTVYGNKGSTDQHAYIQQLREGPNNFFVGFISVLRERAGEKTEVEPGVTSGDYLQGFLLGTRQALFEKGRTSFTLTIDEVNARSIGMLIALFERATTLYASLVGINAFHQPGVEAGKKAAGNVLAAQNKIVAHLAQNPGAHTAAAIGHALGIEPELVYTIGRYVSANGRLIKAEGTDSPASATFRKA